VTSQPIDQESIVNEESGRPGSGNDVLLYELSDGIATVTLNRPQARNALTFQMYERLTEICRNADEDPAVKVVVITGAGEKAFAAGTDISEFRKFETEQDAYEYEARNDRTLSALESCRRPTIAAIAGACTGGGAAIAACCDLRLATADLRFGFPIARTLGNCLSLTNYARLAGLIGPARTKDLIFTARLVGAEEARAMGLINEVVADHAALIDRVGALARQIAGHAPLTLQATKEALRRLQPRPERGEGLDLIRMCYMSDDFREGMEAFLAKRPPNWTGK
jgi:enoyl-CoA hydratase